MKVKLFFIYISFIFPLLASGQSPVRVGDRMPEIAFDQMINYKSGKAKISDFKGKLLIIDVWNKWCSSCIAGFPKLEKIQNNFKDKIQVLLLTSDQMPDFVNIKSRSQNVRSSSLPFVIGDTTIDKLFPHRGVPLHIWIDSSGIVRAITTGFNTNQQTLAKYFSGQPIEMISRENEIQNLDMNKSLLTEGDGRHLDRLLSYSVLLKSMKNYRGSKFDYSRDKRSSKITGMKFINCDIEMFFTMAFNNPRIKMDFPGSEKYIYPLNDDAAKNHFIENYKFCYELKAPQELYDSVSAMQELLKKDLARYFRLQGTVDRQELPCYNLVATGDLDKIRTKDNNQKPVYIKHDFDGIRYTFRNFTISGLVSVIAKKISQLGNSEVNMPVINKTGYKGNIDIELYLKEVNNIEGINELLSRYNLKIVSSFVESEIVTVTRTL